MKLEKSLNKNANVPIYLVSKRKADNKRQKLKD